VIHFVPGNTEKNIVSLERGILTIPFLTYDKELKCAPRKDPPFPLACHGFHFLTPPSGLSNHLPCNLLYNQASFSTYTLQPWFCRQLFLWNVVIHLEDYTGWWLRKQESEHNLWWLFNLILRERSRSWVILWIKRFGNQHQRELWQCVSKLPDVASVTLLQPESAMFQK
jgi:hypothetical protein